MRVAKELVAINYMIAVLENAGYTCLMTHQHGVEDFYMNGHPVEDYTAFSIGYIDYNGELVEEYLGFAFCSVDDPFSPVIGAQMSFSRAMRQFSNHYGRETIKALIGLYSE